MLKQTVLLALVGAVAANAVPAAKGAHMIRDDEDCLALVDGNLEFGSCDNAINFCFDGAYQCALPCACARANVVPIACVNRSNGMCARGASARTWRAL